MLLHLLVRPTGYMLVLRHRVYDVETVRPNTVHQTATDQQRPLRDRNFSPCMSLLLAFPSLSTSLMASVPNFPPPAALAAVSDQLCLQCVPTASFQTCSSSTVGAYNDQDDQQEQRQRGHRHHPDSDNDAMPIKRQTSRLVGTHHTKYGIKILTKSIIFHELFLETIVYRYKSSSINSY